MGPSGVERDVGTSMGMSKECSTSQVFYVLKANNIQLKFSDKRAYAGKGIRHYVFLTLDVLDDIRKRL